jgi:hypothetical protein
MIHPLGSHDARILSIMDCSKCVWRQCHVPIHLFNRTVIVCVALRRRREQTQIFRCTSSATCKSTRSTTRHASWLWCSFRQGKTSAQVKIPVLFVLPPQFQDNSLPTHSRSSNGAMQYPSPSLPNTILPSSLIILCLLPRLNPSLIPVSDTSPPPPNVHHPLQKAA